MKTGKATLRDLHDYVDACRRLHNPVTIKIYGLVCDECLYYIMGANNAGVCIAGYDYNEIAETETYDLVVKDGELVITELCKLPVIYHKADDYLRDYEILSGED